MRFPFLSILLLVLPTITLAAPTGVSPLGDLFGRDRVFTPTRTEKREVSHIRPSSRPSSSPSPSPSASASASAGARYFPRAFVPLPTSLPLGTPNDLARCPIGDLACPVTSSVSGGDIADVEYECITPAEDLYSCGGCSTLGTGQDCSAIPNTQSVSCAAAQCIVHSCLPGFMLASDNACVPALAILS